MGIKGSNKNEIREYAGRVGLIPLNLSFDPELDKITKTQNQIIISRYFPAKYYFSITAANIETRDVVSNQLDQELQTKTKVIDLNPSSHFYILRNWRSIVIYSLENLIIQAMHSQNITDVQLVNELIGRIRFWTRSKKL